LLSPEEISQRLKAAVALHQQGRLDEAEKAYRELTRLASGHPAAYQLLGMIASQRGQAAAALELFDRALGLRPGYADAHNNKGNVLKGLRRYEEALASYERAIAAEADYADAHNNRGAVLQDLGRNEEALASLERAIAADPTLASAYVNRGRTLKELGRLEDALASYDRALALQPSLAEAYYGRGNALREHGRLAEALADYDRAVTLRPGYADAHNNRGLALQGLGRVAEALASYDRALAASPRSAMAHSNRGAALARLRRFDEALASFDQALSLEPRHADAQVNRGLVLQDLGRPEEAAASFDQALEIDPRHAYLAGTALLAKLQIAHWEGYESALAALNERIGRGEKATPPFDSVVLDVPPALQRRAAEIWLAGRHGRAAAFPARPRGERIRIGYFSADYYEHATAYLMAELFEKHDRGRFEVVAFSFGPDKDDAMRRRLARAFERFLDVRERSDEEIARLSRELGIDIAVDLKGFTRDSRAGIFSWRAAPVQVAYLGYPGTTGAPYMDYLVADENVIPPGQRAHYSEKIAFLPGSYQCNDTRRPVARAMSRAELGLPEEAFVYCCFNNTFKITPGMFDRWMRILRRVHGSVLWLLEDNRAATRSLRSEAEKRGIAADRLLFAGRLPLAEHLARHRAADLFLDTVPCNAHTTASDALWAGLPLLTCPGDSFASRVATSLLKAANLPELVASTGDEYESLAVDLAEHPERLRALRRRLEEGRASCELFDPALLARRLETAYERMHERSRAGLPPEDIRVAR
jgi:predicted O-linked N-acetylglucosamine transferase (SPINDLY family)